MLSVCSIDVQGDTKTDTCRSIYHQGESPKVFVANEAVKCGGLLTLREREVLHWLALGKSANSIARILKISVCTVRAHIRNIFLKLDASNIPHAVARAFKKRILNV